MVKKFAFENEISSLKSNEDTATEYIKQDIIDYLQDRLEEITKQHGVVTQRD
jgi:hypothetical protein